MNRHLFGLLGVTTAAALLVVSCSQAPRNDTLRPTNAELRIISQSCFQGEIEPCG